METATRWIWIVLDSVGIGAAPDAHLYGKADEQSHTLRHVAEAVGGLTTPNLARLGLGCIDTIPGVACGDVAGAYGKMQEQSVGKDTTNGHWEYVGVILRDGLPVYPHGFPPAIIQPFEDYVGKPILCNRPASGTEVIAEFGPEHERTGRPIVYTSADSVFQVAAHESVVPVELLYAWCAYARRILTGEHGVGRVIARPFTGSSGNYQRTHRRRDFSLTFGETALNRLVEAGFEVTGIGKIFDIYGGSGITNEIHTTGNEDGMRRIADQMNTQKSGLIYANLVDFDALYGHRNDPVGFARALETFDRQLPDILSRLEPTDVLCITADHGCDPTTSGTDHSREWVPVLLYHSGLTQPIALGDRHTFADVGATLTDSFGLPHDGEGASMWPLVRGRA